jgi:RNA polymerase sigma factor (sigma-70 family)
MSTISDDEEETWARARSGDGAAFASMFRLHQTRIFRRALTLSQQPHDADDITAAVFFELWRKRHNVRVVNGTIFPWLSVTTVNVARNHHRVIARYRKLIASLPRDEALNPESIAVRRIETDVLGVRLSDALAQLSATDTALLVLTVLDELSVTDAASVLGIKPGTARMRLHRARARLQNNLGDDRFLRAAPLPEGEHA